MDYIKRQEELFDDIEKRLSQGDKTISVVAPPDDYEQDKRLCLTSLTFIPAGFQEQIYEKVINPLKEADPHQYFYKPHSLHLTICNVRVINDPPHFDNNIIQLAQQAFDNVVPKFKAITVNVKGLFELPYNLGLRAYIPEEFRDLALALRSELSKVGAPDDKQYASNDVIAGNITICRYNSKPTDNFMKKVKELKNIELGGLGIKEFALLTTNAVLSPEKTRIIKKYRLT